MPFNGDHENSFQALPWAGASLPTTVKHSGCQNNRVHVHCREQPTHSTYLCQAEPSLTKRSRKAVTEQNYPTKNEDSLFPMNLYQALKEVSIVCYKVQEFCNNWGKKNIGAFLGRIYFLDFVPYVRTFDITFKYNFSLEKAQTYVHISI